MKRFAAALRFLTIIPLPMKWGMSEPELSGSLPFFPVVAVLIGAAAAGLAWCLGFILPPLPSGALIVVALLTVSGGLHIDGLSDTADGFFSSRSRERILEIMKDSHAGPMGVAAVACVLILKFAALGSLPAATLWRAAFLMPVAGRCALLLGMAVLPYARPEGGLAGIFYKTGRKLSAVWALAVLAGTGFAVAGVAGLISAGCSVLSVLLVSAWSYRKIGGATGDTLGASCEVAETVAALAMVAWYFASGL